MYEIPDAGANAVGALPPSLHYGATSRFTLERASSRCHGSRVALLFTLRRMSRIRHLIAELRRRSDVGVVDEAQSWRICITKGRDLICEVTVPHDVLEWFASVKHRRDKAELWFDSMDYSGYDDRPREQLEVEMAGDVLAFIDRVSIAEPLLPLKIYEGRA
jgi:hypothetical protein